ncbi:MAG TPA: 3-keto-5-aminohexanoate cleavage protein [Burkholderiaceae bacterium]|nr:3-keto-5-aminohexanoate cleavage protein [Burkholderiaceae bacterium]
MPARPVIIEARVNEWALRGANPHVPWSPEEIADDAERCWRAGASIVHFHVRRPDGSGSHDTELYARTIRAIRERCDILIHPTLAGVVTPTARERLAPLRSLLDDPATRPDFVPIDMGSTNLDVYDPLHRRFHTEEKTYVNTVRTMREIGDVLREADIAPLLCAWTVPCLRTIDAFIDAGWLAEPLLVCIVLTEGGILGGHPGTVEGLASMVRFLPPSRALEWSVACRQGSLLALAQAAIGQGGHVAIGLGDHAYAEDGAPTNAQLVARVAGYAAAAGRPVASVRQTRELLKMDERHTATEIATLTDRTS